MQNLPGMNIGGSRRAVTDAVCGWGTFLKSFSKLKKKTSDFAPYALLCNSKQTVSCYFCYVSKKLETSGGNPPIASKIHENLSFAPINKRQIFMNFGRYRGISPRCLQPLFPGSASGDEHRQVRVLEIHKRHRPKALAC